MNVGNNKLTSFIIIFSFLALGCGRDSYNSNREEFSFDLLVDRTAPVAILTTAIISSSGNAMVQSTETGTVYLVNTNVTVTNLASITGAADNQWNSAALSSLSVLTLPATGLVDGIYRAYAVDDAGNLSSASTNSVTIDSIAPTANFTAATDNVGSITGALTSGSITDDTALVLTGTNESGSGVKIYNGSTEIGSATVSGTNWSYTATVANGTTYQFNVKETDLAGHISDATSNFTVTGDTVAPTASVNTAAITSTGNAVIQSTATGTVVLLNTSASTTSGNAVVQSTETGTVYLVKTTVTVTNLASITGAALYQWNSVAISSASTNTNLSVAGLADGTYKVYAVDEAGGLSSASVNSVIIDTTPPSIESVAITSAVGITGNLLNTGDVVSVTTTFTEQVIVDNSSGTPTLTLVVGSTNQTATYASGSGSSILVFQYTIQAGENDSDGISIEANALALNNATISDPIGFPAVITHSAVSANSSYLVDAQAPPVISFTLSDTALKVGDNATVILVFAEAVLLFSSSDDITVSNGSLDNMTSPDNTVWTGTFTPTPNTEDATNTLSLGTSYTDTAGNTGASATTANYEIDTLAPTISSVAISSATGVQNDFVNAGDVVSVTATFSESVIVDNASGTPTLTLILGSANRSATYVSGSGSRPLVFQYTIQTGDNDSNGISIGTNALDLDNATIMDAAGNNATLTHSSVDNNSSYKVDAILPTIDSVEITNATTGMQNNFLNAGDVVSVTATFSEVVNKTGTPQLTLAIGSDNETATYASGTGSAPLVFQYTIQAGDNDTNGISIGADAIDLDNGPATISDPAGNNAILTHSSVDNNSSYMVDTEAPRVDNFTLSDVALKSGDNGTVTLGFSEVVIGFTAADITNPNGALPSMLSDDNKTWTGTFTPATNTVDATNTLSLSANSYTDLAGNNGPSATFSNYVVETRLPTLSGVVITSATGVQNSFVNAGDVVTLTASFSESVIVDNTSNNPTLTLALESSNPNATYTSGNNSTSLVFQYTIQTGDTDSNGISIGSDALALNSATIRDAAENNATLTHSSVGNNSGFMVDTTPPTVDSVAITGGTNMQNNFLNAADKTGSSDVVSATVTFSELVNKTGTPKLTLAIGSDNETANYDSGTGSPELVFKYTIQAGDNDTDGISIGANAIDLDNGTISDPAGNNATLTHSSVSSNPSFMVDTEAPRVNNFTLDNETGIDDLVLLIGETATVNLVFSEAVCVVSSACRTNVFADDDITHPNGTLSTMLSSDNITWNGTFTPTPNLDFYVSDDAGVDNNTLSLRGGVSYHYTDLAGNKGPSATFSSYEVDTFAPTGTFTISDRFLRRDRTTGVADNATITITFREPVIGFDNSDITIPNLNQATLHDNSTVSGTLSTMLSDDNETWTGTFTPTFPETEDWTNTFTLGTSYTDVDGNPGVAATSRNYMVDDIYPNMNGSATITIENNNSDNDSLILWSQTATVTVTFPEPVNVYSQGNNDTNDCNNDSATGTPNVSIAASFDMDNATGALSNLQTGSNCLGTSWTATFTPTDDMEVLINTITLKGGYDWTDQVGNPGFDNVTSVFEVETWRPRPTITITHPDGDNGTTGTGSTSTCCGSAKPGFRPGDNGTLTVSFDDKAGSYDPEVYNFSNADITVPSYANLSTMTTTDNITWTGHITPDDNATGAYSTVNSQGSSYDLTFTVNKANYNDLKGNPGYENVSSNIVVDTKPPVVEHVRVKDSRGSFLCGGNLVDCIGEGASFTRDDGTYRCVPVDSDIQVIFDYVMIPTFVTADESTSCGATTQVSSDNFANCVAMTEDPDASSHNSITNKKFTLEPADNLSYFTTYKVRVTTGVKDALENQMTSQYTHATEFRTSAFPSSTPTSGVFVAVGQYGSHFRSIDNGTSWDNETCSFLDNDFHGVTYANDTFIAAGENGRLVKSTNNASSWQVSNPFSSVQINGIAFGGSTLNVVGANGSSGYTYISSNNGSSWSPGQLPSTSLQTLSPNGRAYYYNKSLYGVAFGNSTFVAVGDVGKILRSTDNGANWSHVTTGYASNYGNNYKASLNGINNLRGVSFGNNTFVAVGYSGKIITSTDDGSSWDNETAVNSNNLYGVTFGNSTFVAVGSNGTIVKSTNNGASWSSSSSGTSETLFGVTFGNNTFMAVGNSGTIVKSTDNGANWSSSSSGTTNNLYGVAFGD